MRGDDIGEMKMPGGAETLVSREVAAVLGARMGGLGGLGKGSGEEGKGSREGGK